MPSLSDIDTVFLMCKNSAGDYVQVTYCRNTNQNKGRYYRDPSPLWVGTPATLHRAVWEKESGLSIPKGYQIHHLDHNPAHNQKSNLKCIHSQMHIRYHKAVGRLIREMEHRVDRNINRSEAQKIAFEAGIKARYLFKFLGV